MLIIETIEAPSRRVLDGYSTDHTILSRWKISLRCTCLDLAPGWWCGYLPTALYVLFMGRDTEDTENLSSFRPKRCDTRLSPRWASGTPCWDNDVPGFCKLTLRRASRSRSAQVPLLFPSSFFSTAWFPLQILTAIVSELVGNFRAGLFCVFFMKLP